MKFIILILFQIEVFANCIVPNILLETIRLTENETSYPYWIRTNELKNLDKFNEIIRKFNFKSTQDEMLVDCINFDNCTTLVEALIRNDITNLDLGLFQINFKTYPRNANIYFDEDLSYSLACKIIEEKISITKKWNWDTLASYHSFTPERNKIYKKRLINNYKKLIKMKNF